METVTETGNGGVTAREFPLVRRPVAALAPYARNARTHSDEQVAQIAASIREFGFTNPVLVDDAGGIVAGHGRVMAARMLGLPTVPCIVLAGLTEAQRRAYVLADNKIALNAGWDEALLRQELDALLAEGFDLALTGFSDSEIAALEVSSPAAGRDPNARPPDPAFPRSARGDVFELGAHRVMCGDATLPGEVAVLLAGEPVDAVWTDPPYNVDYGAKVESLGGGASRKGGSAIANDNLGPEAFLAFLSALFKTAFDAMRAGASIYVAHADTEGLAFRRAFALAGFKLSACLVWRKDALVLGRSDYQWIHEPILYGWKPGAKHRWFGGRKQVTVQDLRDGTPFTQRADGRWEIVAGDRTLVVDGDARVEEFFSTVLDEPKPRRNGEHPTMKPVGLIEKQLRHSARQDDVVYDCCGGSGSTLIAAERLGLRARLMELEPVYVDVIVQRWQEYSGGKARRLSDGAPFDEIAPREETRAAA